MSRLPVVGGDVNTWGTVLNDYLGIAHDTDGTLKGAWGALSVKQYGAAGDGVTDDATDIQATINAADAAIVVFPLATYLTSALTVDNLSKIDGRWARLKPAANSMTVLSFTSTAGLQSADMQVIRNLIVDCSAKTTVTGLATTAGASTVLERITVLESDVYGFDLYGIQFVSTYDLKATGGAVGVGMRIANDTSAGGGNSHDHYRLILTDMEVGLFVNGTRFSTPCWSLNFYNPQFIGNSVCGAAFFHANATCYGGAPEYNATGSATKTVDGQTVKRSSMHLNDSLVRCENLSIGEATANPVFLLESSSILTLKDVSGYGNTSGVLVQADATSGVVLEGVLAAQGIVQNVIAWPDSLVLHPTGQSILYGEPVHAERSNLPVVYSHQQPPLAGQGANPPTMTYAEDTYLGPCRQAAFSSTAGSVNNNFCSIGSITGAASQDTIISVLVQATGDTQIGFNLHDGASYNAINTERIFLKAGKATRLVFGMRNVAAGSWTLIFYAVGTDSPTVKFSCLQVYQGATGTQVTTQDIASIIHDGAFNPGPTRDTTTNLAAQSAEVNTHSKYAGKQVWNVTTNRVVFAAGNAAGDVWKDGVDSTVHTPV